jgi:hypothetical protein
VALRRGTVRALEEGTEPRLERALGSWYARLEKSPFGDALFGAAACGTGLDLETGSLFATTDLWRKVWATGR